jgi:hypothetical protein
MSNTDPTKNRVDPRCSRRISSYKDLLFLLVFKAFVLLCSSMSWNKLLCTLFWYNNRIENKTVYRQINDLPLQLTIKIWNYNINNLVHVTDFICYVKWTFLWLPTVLLFLFLYSYEGDFIKELQTEWRIKAFPIL